MCSRLRAGPNVPVRRAKDIRRIFRLADGPVYRQIMPSAPMQTRWERFKLWLARRISNRKY
jgi:hypothetical protein